MNYRAAVRVFVLALDETTGNKITTERRDMNFEVLINEPGEGVKAAKVAFGTKHGPDLAVRCCNMQDRKTVLLYCCPAKHMPQNLGARNPPFVKPLAQRTR